MRSLTTSDDYRDHSTFENELSALFESEWQLAGFRRDVAGDRDYIVAQIGRIPVVIQNFDGELKAFRNVCSHRFSAIRRDCKGNGPLQCQYHGWVFDRAGIPVGIANVREFDDITPERRQELALESWDVEACGELVFVRPAALYGASLREFIGGAWEKTEAIGSALGEQVDCNRMIVEANWKVVVENTLESYHVHSIHPATFATLQAQTAGFEFHQPHSSWQATIDPSMGKQLARLMKMLGLSSRFDGYFHQLIFPALTLATTSGMTYAIQSFRPLSPRQTEFTSYVFAARRSGSDSQRELLTQACESAVKFNRQVFEEDRLICCEVQRGVDHARGGLIGELSREEQRVLDFQREWRERLGRWKSQPA
jgi:phenylpropionate dioxygenase-like ring-hydroxylating dioxygenase large terminal subunit